MRLSLLPSALADIAAGTVLGAGRWPAGAAPFLLMAGSACVYHGGMALNDWADREADARDGRPRPIARAEIGATTALALAVLLLVSGPLVAWLAHPRAAACLGAVAVLAALYDLAGRGPWLGPLLLGACRAGNLGSGIVLGRACAPSFAPDPAQGAPIALAALAALYGSYVFFVSRLARLEDRPEPEIARGRPGGWLLLASIVLGLLGAAGVAATHLDREAEPRAWIGAAIAVLLGGWGAVTLFRAGPKGVWRAPDAGRLAGMGLRRLLVATGSLAASSGTLHGLVVAGAILCGYPLSFALRRVFPPT